MPKQILAPHRVMLQLDGKRLELPEGQNLVAALANAGHWQLGVDGPQALQALCVMGSCMACRVRIDGEPRRACRERVREGMQVSTYKQRSRR